MNGKNNQRGIALLTVMLVLALAVLLVAGMLRHQALLTRTSGLQLEYRQLREAALAGEYIARQRLQKALQGEGVRTGQVELLLTSRSTVCAWTSPWKIWPGV